MSRDPSSNRVSICKSLSASSFSKSHKELIRESFFQFGINVLKQKFNHSVVNERGDRGELKKNVSYDYSKTFTYVFLIQSGDHKPRLLLKKIKYA